MKEASPIKYGQGAQPETWTLLGVLDEIRSINERIPERSFAFILGSGASVRSGIPSGQSMADTWIRELHRRSNHADQTFEDWVVSDGPGIEGLSKDNIAEHYPEIFERRFRGDRDAGYACLEALMDGKEPSLGYSLLAEIMKDTRHKVVVTTNFDNLVADALAIHAHKPPLVVGHEALTGFIRPSQRRPLVAKIHRDLFLEPRSDVDGVSKLAQGWQDALGKLFQSNTPIVIGYGGNDGSLMGLLKKMPPGTIVGRMFWCFRPDSPPNATVRQIVAQHHGILVPIAGFDEFMLQLTDSLVAEFDLGRIALRLEQLGQKRAERYRDQAEKIRRRAGSEDVTGSRGTDEGGLRTTQEIMAVALRDESNWWTWEMRARSKVDFDAREKIYRAALQRLPSNADLLVNYAQLLERANKRTDAIKQYRLAVQERADDPVILRTFASFLSNDPDGHDEAELAYKRALNLGPDIAETIGKYAEFLAYCRNHLTAAEQQYAEALRLDPTNAVITRNYATFLISRRQKTQAAEEMYERAMVLNPHDALTTGNLAYFLEREKGEVDRPEKLYRKAIALDPTVTLNLANFGWFLLRKRGKASEAESVFKKTLDLSPGHSAYTGNYVNLLLNHRRDFAAAAQSINEALAHEPDNPNNAVNLAAVRLCQGIIGESRAAARGAIKLAKPKISQIIAEALFYDAVLSEMTMEDPAPSLSRLKGVIEKGYSRTYWDFSVMLEKSKVNATEEKRKFFGLIAEAILDEKLCVQLLKDVQWNALPVLDPFSPFVSGS